MGGVEAGSLLTGKLGISLPNFDCRRQPWCGCYVLTSNFKHWLFPNAAISVVPGRLIRDREDVNALVCHIGEFVKANMQSIIDEVVVIE